MNEQCRGCKYHHNAGHKDKQNRYNDWCCKFVGPASSKLGHCKLNGGKEIEWKK